MESDNIFFGPKPTIKPVGLTTAPHPTDPNKVVCTLHFEVQMPDPKKCGVIRNVSLPESLNR